MTSFKIFILTFLLSPTFYAKTNTTNKNKGIFLTNMTNKVLLTKFWPFCTDMKNTTALSFLDGRFSYIGNIQKKLFCIGVMKKVDLVNSFNGGDENCFSWSGCAIWGIPDFHCALALGDTLYWFSHAVKGASDDEDGFGLGRRAHRPRPGWRLGLKSSHSSS